jgi:divalent metal cation (Fe/Co/Zn/Cd) transporter
MRRPVALLIALVLVLAVGRSFGYLRAAAALAMGAAIFYVGFGYFRSAGASQPDPDVEDVSDESLRYVCTMCGLELKVEVAASDRAPSHCREKMVLVQGPRRPPLHPV